MTYMLTAPQVVDRTGASYRKLDYWTRIGLIVPAAVADSGGNVRSVRREDLATPGSGLIRMWTLGEVAVVERIVRLTAAGLELKVAAKVARASGSVSIGPGVTIRVSDPGRSTAAPQVRTASLTKLRDHLRADQEALDPSLRYTPQALWLRPESRRCRA